MFTQGTTIQKLLTTSWTVTFYGGGVVVVNATSEAHAMVMAARMVPWATVRKAEAWD